jgi:hypothetical protein
MHEPAWEVFVFGSFPQAGLLYGSGSTMYILEYNDADPKE